MSEKVFFENSKGQKICGVLEEIGDKKEIVILVHGFSSSKEGFSSRQVAEELANRNKSSIRIDLDGCGESEGEFENQTITSSIDDIKSAINFCKGRGYEKFSLFGSSMGGLSVMATALEVPEIVRIGMKAPVSDYPAQKSRKSGDEAIEKWKRDGHYYYLSGDGRKLKVNYTFFEDSQKYVMKDKVKGIECPALIIHGTADDIVSIDFSREVIKEFPNCKLVELEGADHALALNGDRGKSNTLFADWFTQTE